MIATTGVLFVLHMATVCLACLVSLAMGRAALSSFVCLCWVCANFFVTKQISLLGMAATAADPYVVGAVLGSNLLIEFYGRKAGRQTLYTAFILMCTYLVFSYLHISYAPHTADWAHPHFVALLTPMPCLIAASLATYCIVQALDYALFIHLQKMSVLPLVVRSTATLLITQACDTLLFAVLGLYGIVDGLLGIFVVSYTVKVIAILSATPFSSLASYVHRYARTTLSF